MAFLMYMYDKDIKMTKCRKSDILFFRPKSFSSTPNWALCKNALLVLKSGVQLDIHDKLFRVEVVNLFTF